jgi:SHS2 domain-containing protein
MFTILEHPSDIGIEATEATLKEAFSEAAKGLLSIILDLSTVRTARTEALELRAQNFEDLLVRWLQEILFLYDAKGFIAKETSISELTPHSVKAALSGEDFSSEKHETLLDVKAITYHQLVVREDKHGGFIRVFFDI